MGVPPQEVGFVEKYTVGIQVMINVQVLTKDSVTVSVDAVVYYRQQLNYPHLKELFSSNTTTHQNISTLVIGRVSNATVSVANVEDCHSSTRLLAQVCSVLSQAPSFSSTPTSCSSDHTAEHPWHEGPAPNPERPGEHLNLDAGGQTIAALINYTDIYNGMVF